MAVEARFIVIRNGVDMDTFTDKKTADQYDRMLDMADAVSELLSSSSIDLAEAAKEELAIFLSKNRDEVLYALQAKKRPTPEPSPKATTKPAKTKASKE